MWVGSPRGQNRNYVTAERSWPSWPSRAGGQLWIGPLFPFTSYTWRNGGSEGLTISLLKSASLTISKSGTQISRSWACVFYPIATSLNFSPEALWRWVGVGIGSWISRSVRSSRSKMRLQRRSFPIFPGSPGILLLTVGSPLPGTPIQLSTQPLSCFHQHNLFGTGDWAFPWPLIANRISGFCRVWGAAVSVLSPGGKPLLLRLQLS